MIFDELLWTNELNQSKRKKWTSLQFAYHNEMNNKSMAFIF